MHMCTTSQQREATLRTMADYIIANSMALGVIDKIIDVYPPYINLRKYHSHLLIQTCYGGTS